MVPHLLFHLFYMLHSYYYYNILMFYVCSLFFFIFLFSSHTSTSQFYLSTSSLVTRVFYYYYFSLLHLVFFSFLLQFHRVFLEMSCFFFLQYSSKLINRMWFILTYTYIFIIDFVQKCLCVYVCMLCWWYVSNFFLTNNIEGQLSNEKLCQSKREQ